MFAPFFQNAEEERQLTSLWDPNLSEALRDLARFIEQTREAMQPFDAQRQQLHAQLSRPQLWERLYRECSKTRFQEVMKLQETWKENEAFAVLSSEQLRQLYDIYFPALSSQLECFCKQLAQKKASIENDDIFIPKYIAIKYQQLSERLTAQKVRLAVLQKHYSTAVLLRGRAYLDLGVVHNHVDNELAVFLLKIHNLGLPWDPVKVEKGPVVLSFDTRQFFYCYLKNKQHPLAQMLTCYQDVMPLEPAPIDESYFERLAADLRAFQPQEASFLKALVTSILEKIKVPIHLVTGKVTNNFLAVKNFLYRFSIVTFLVKQLGFGFSLMALGVSLVVSVTLPFFQMFRKLCLGLYGRLGFHQKPQEIVFLQALEVIRLTGHFIHNRLLGRVYDSAGFGAQAFCQDMAWFQRILEHSLQAILQCNETPLRVRFREALETKQEELQSAFTAKMLQLIEDFRQQSQALQYHITKKQLLSLRHLFSVARDSAILIEHFEAALDREEAFCTALSLKHCLVKKAEKGVALPYGGYVVHLSALDFWAKHIEFFQAEGPKKEALKAVCQAFLSGDFVGLRQHSFSARLMREIQEMAWHITKEPDAASIAFFSEKHCALLKDFVVKEATDIQKAKMQCTEIALNSSKALSSSIQAVLPRYGALLSLLEVARMAGAVPDGFSQASHTLRCYCRDYTGENPQMLIFSKVFAPQERERLLSQCFKKRVAWIMLHIEAIEKPELLLGVKECLLFDLLNHLQARQESLKACLEEYAVIVKTFSKKLQIFLKRSIQVGIFSEKDFYTCQHSPAVLTGGTLGKSYRAR